MPLTVIRLAPNSGNVSVSALLSPLTAPPELEPFAPPTLAFLEALHRRLLGHAVARNHPELQALGFWLRPAALARLAVGFQASLPSATRAVPRGLVFHVPPTNVDTLFVYSWVPALLAGNRNLIRLSDRGIKAADGEGMEHGLSTASRVLLEIIGALLATPEAAAIAAATALVCYPHDDVVTATLSRAADVRLLWGGDATVTHLRTLPTAPHALDLAFPDRVSWAALSAEAYLALGVEHRGRVAEALFNDIFWFNQQACSSPRLLVWVGPSEAVAAAAADLYPRVVAETVTKGYEPGPGAQLDRLAAWHRAVLDLPVVDVRDHDGVLTVLRLTALESGYRDTLTVSGSGVLLEARVTALTDCLPMVSRRVQTLGHFGFSAETLSSFARALNGRGIDRMVPLGQALSFATTWDGTDLLRALTCLATVAPGSFELGRPGDLPKTP